MKKERFLSRRWLSLLLTLALVFALALPAAAAASSTTESSGEPGEPACTITIIPGDFTDVTKTDRYHAYQIFSGRLTEGAEPGTDQSRELADIQWGAGVDAKGLLSALLADETLGEAFAGIDELAEEAQAPAVAKVLEGKKNDAAFVKAFAKLAAAHVQAENFTASTYDAGSNTFKVEVEGPGYYLIIDAPTAEGLDPGDVVSEYMLEVLGNQTMKVKADAPSVDKELYSAPQSYEIGQLVQYRLVGNIAENFMEYETYYYQFVDHLSQGLTFEKDTVKLELWKLEPLDAENPKSLSERLTEKVSDIDSSLYVVSDAEAMPAGGTQFTVTFDDLKKVDGVQADYAVVVFYSARLNEDVVIEKPQENDVELVFSNNPNSDSHGLTPGPKVYTYSFALDVEKVDAVNHETVLSDVGFKLYKQEPVPDGEPVTNWAVFDVVTPPDGEDGDTQYLLKEDGTSWVEAEADATEVFTDENGMLHIVGLSEGTYFLRETTPANGYNKLLEDIEVKIEATYYAEGDEDLEGHEVGELRNVTVTVNGEVLEGASVSNQRISFTVLNTPATNLPSTGGSGVLLYYIGGGALLVLAVVCIVLINRKGKKKNS